MSSTKGVAASNFPWSLLLISTLLSHYSSFFQHPASLTQHTWSQHNHASQLHSASVSPQYKGKAECDKQVEGHLGCLLEDVAQLDRQNHMARALSFSSIYVLVSSNNYLLAHQDKQISLPTGPQQQNRSRELCSQWDLGIAKSFLI